MLILALLAALALPHGGRYLPPPPDPELDDGGRPGAPLSQPGTGPPMTFQAGRWEWWFDFNQEFLVRLRERQREAAAREDVPDLRPVTDEDRLRTLLPVLVDALRSGRRDVRAAAAMSLARLAVPAALPFVEVATEDDDLFVRTQAILALGVTGQGAAVEALARRLGDRDLSDEERTFAAAGLGLLGTPEAVEVLLERAEPRRLALHGHQLRVAVVSALGLTGSPAALAGLERLLDSHLGRVEADLRALAGVALGQLGLPEGLPALLGLLREDDNQVRRSAAAGLGGLARWLDDEQLAGVLARYDRESDLPARAHLLHALGLVRRERSRDFLRDVLERTPALLRPHAAMALGLDGHPTLAGPLLEVLEDQHETSVRAALLVALGFVGTPEVAEPLREQIERATDPALAGYLALALGLAGVDEQEVVRTLVDWAATSPDVELVRQATLALGLLGRQDELLALASSLDEVRGTVHRAARLFALGAVGDRRLLEPLVAVVEDETQPSFVRTYAVQALGALGDPRDIPPLARLSRNVDLDHEAGFVFELYQLY